MVDDDDLQLRAQGRIGTVLCGKYRIDHVLGVGGMAVVYAATHRNQKRVAVKMLHAELSMHKEVRARFLREGYAANTVDHPGAVAVLDDDIAEDGAAFLVMERLEGDEVERIWERHGRLDARVVLAIADPLLAVLQAAHAKSVVHRDIKPANLYITHDGTLKVLDFGIARSRDAASEGQRGTKTGMLLGTPAYMAPEQALAKSKEIDGTTDLWSVGATLYALLSGHLVHDAESATAVLVQAATQPARSLALAAPDVDPRIVAIVDRALVFDKAGRWPDAATMRAAVRDAYEAMFGAKVSKDPLERLLAAPAAIASTMLAPSVPQPTFTPPPAVLSRREGGGSQVSSAVSSVLTAPPAQQSFVASGPPPVVPAQAAYPYHPHAGLSPMGSMPAAPALFPVPPGASPATTTARRPSFLLPALVAMLTIVVGAGIVALAWQRTNATPTAAPVVTASAPEPVVVPAPPPDAADTADVDVAPSAPLPVTSDVPSPSPLPPTPPPTPLPVKTVSRPQPSLWTAAPPPVLPAPAPAPVAPAPAPMCRAQCVESSRACKSRCKNQGGPRRERHPCLVDCESAEHECKAHAPC